MGRHRRITARSSTVAAAFAVDVLFGAVVAFGTATVGCREQPKPPGPAPSISAPPVDRLAPNETPPGVELAHDLILPRGSIIEGRFGTAVHANVPLTPEEVANYVRQQATTSDGSGVVESVMGPNGTLFPNLHVNGSDVGHHLRVEVTAASMGNGTTVIVDRIEDRPPPAAMPPDEVMKKAGLNPNGSLADPNHIE